MATNNTEYFVSLTDSDVQTFLEVEKKKYKKRNQKLPCFGHGISHGCK